jgi:hypothetical protein
MTNIDNIDTDNLKSLTSENNVNINNDYGFIITRHVNSEKTNRYWNNCIICIRRFYPNKKIVIIDDNSRQHFVKADFNYRNIEIIQSQYPGAGELLPYYYLLKRRFFENAVIIHDSVFFHRRINFESFKSRGIQALSLWHFDSDKENVNNSLRIANYLKNSQYIKNLLVSNDIFLGPRQFEWKGVFGVQSYINLKFLHYINAKYNICNMIHAISCREDRCCLERIMGCIFFTESKRIRKLKSVFGNIFSYQKWGYTYEKYKDDISKKRLPKAIVKIWTGR